MRRCGDCQLCCELLPVRAPALNKDAGVKCKHQKFHKGCTVYGTAAMPLDCAIWNCRWLTEDDTADQSRPDRSHYVIDIMPDYITAVDNETGASFNVEVVQVWIDPKYRDAIRDPQLRAYMLRRAKEGKATICRFNQRDATTVFAPVMADDHEWHEVSGGTLVPQHSIEDVAAALSR